MADALKIRRAFVAVGDDMRKLDVIDHAGGLWLVVDWRYHLDRGVRSPIRIVRMDTLPHQGAVYDVDFVVNVPVPQVVLDGVALEIDGSTFEVIDSPPIEDRMPPSAMH